LEQGVDLLASFNSQTTANQSQGRQQRLNRIYEIGWTYELRHSRYTLALASSSQEYEAARFAQEELRLELEHRMNPLDRLMLGGAFRTAQEKGQVQRVIDKRYALIDGGWRHYWGYDTRLFGGRAFVQGGARLERVWEGQRRLERKALSLTLGQEWR